MKILVGIKRVLDFAIKPQIRKDGKWVETEGMKHSINPFDEIALEEAIKIKEKLPTQVQVIAASCGDKKNIETIRSALAMGADRAIHIECPAEGGLLQPLTVAKLFSSLIKHESPDLVLLGKQAIDDDSCQTGQMLAGILNWPQATFASKISIEFDKKEATVTCEVDTGSQDLLIKLPAVITVDLRLNEPRLISLQNIMKAKKKPVETIQISNLLQSEHERNPRLEILNVTAPPERTPGRKVGSVEELLNLLQKDAKVLQLGE